MESKKTEQKSTSEIRKRAEKKLTSQITATGAMSDKKTRQLIHELQVHQIELEMQNDELRKAQAELEESRSKYSDLYDFAPVGYFTFDRKGLILEANLTAAKELGIERGLLVNKPFRAYIVTEDREVFDSHLQKVFKSDDRQTCEIRLKRKDGIGIYAQLESIAANDLKGNPLCRSSVIDVTERKLIEGMLNRKYNQINSILNSADEGIYGVDGNGDAIFINPSLLIMTGFEAGELLGKNLHFILRHSGSDGISCKSEECPVFKTLEEGEVFTNITGEVIRRKDGTTFPVEYTSAPLFEHDRVVGAVIVIKDISSRLKAEEEIQRLSRDLERRVVERTIQLQTVIDELEDEIISRRRTEKRLKSLVRRFEALWEITGLIDADMKTICDHVLLKALELTGSSYAFYGSLNQDENIMTIYSWSEAAMADCALYEKPPEFSIADAGIWANAIRRRTPFILNDYQEDHPGKKGLPSGHVLIKRLMVVPVFSHGRIVAVAGVANKPAEYKEEDVRELDILTTTAQIFIDSKKTEDSLMKEHYFRESIINNAAEGLCVCYNLRVHPYIRFTVWNNRMTEITGYTMEEMNRMGWYQTMYHDPETRERAKQLMDRMRQGDDPRNEEWEITRKDGKKRIIYFKASLLEVSEKNVYVLALMNDVTDRKRVEEEIPQQCRENAETLMRGNQL